jgi:hypothetical protein
VRLDNLGQADVSDVEYKLTTGGVDFITNDSLTGVLSTNNQLNLLFKAPSFDTSVVFEFTLTSTPLDLNTEQPAIIGDTLFTFPIRVELLRSELLIDASIVGSNLIVPGRDKELLQVTLSNQGSSSLSDITLYRLFLSFRNEDNELVDVEDILDLQRTKFVENGADVDAALFGGDRLTAYFSNFTINPQATRSISLVASVVEASVPPVTLVFESDNVEARYLEGPYVGDTVSIVTLSGDHLLVSQTYVTRGEDFEESFLIKDNPFNPNTSPAEFSYELQQPSSVEFRVFTLTGEEVYALDIIEGESESTTGEHILTWDGRNNEGNLVNSGVYIVSLKVLASGDKASIKVAVVK